MKTIILFSAAGALMVCAPAQAYSEFNISDQNSTQQFEVNVCSSNVSLDVSGDGSSDLDFVVVDPFGNIIFENDDFSDTMSVALAKGAGGQCWTYTLFVENLGSRNEFQISVTDLTGIQSLTANSAASGAASITPIAGSRNTSFALNICSPQATIEAVGQGNTDLDFMIMDDASGTIVHEDDDLTDQTAATLMGLGGSGCRAYTMGVDNLGGAVNQVSLTLLGANRAAARPAPRPQPQPQTRPQTRPQTQPQPQTQPTQPSRPLPQGKPSSAPPSTQPARPNLAQQQALNAQPIDFYQSVSRERTTVGNLRPDQQTYAVLPGETMIIDLLLCTRSVTIAVSGDDDTDVDYEVFDGQGALVHSDSELHDDMFVTLSTQAASGACETVRLEASNLGNIFNNVTVTLTDN